MHPSQIQKDLIHALESALHSITKAEADSKLPDNLAIELESPRDPRRGDLTTTISLRLAKKLSQNPVKLATTIKDKLDHAKEESGLGRFISKIEVAPPGFINFWFSKDYLFLALSEILRRKTSYGKSRLGKGCRVNIEFVSANPTGPLTVAHGRQAAVGDALARILEFSGYRVTKEYFINDVGTQVSLLGQSIYSHYAAINGVDSEFPADGYRGDYIKKIAEEFNRENQKRYLEKTDRNIALIADFGTRTILNGIEGDLAKFGVQFHNWFSQKQLSEAKINRVLDALRAKGYIYDKDGAVWFKSTSFGDGKDRVCVKTDGTFTYLAPDIAYHLTKYKRKFDRIIDIWGPDHHGYIPRLAASIQALGYDKNSISILIVQLATLYRDGEAISMSTRKGEFITLQEVVDEVGCDVAKYFFLTRTLDGHLDFDLAVAKKNSGDNPVYYIQYAHARISSILDFSEKMRAELKKTSLKLGLLVEEEETRLLKMMLHFQRVVVSSARGLEPYRIVEYLNDLAKAFHSFYTKHRVVSESDLPLTKARLTLVEGVKVVLANGLNLLGISFPERM